MPKNDKTYQELQLELDEIMQKLQTGDVDVEESVKLYEDGLKVVKQLETKLASAENKVTKLKNESQL